MADQDINIAQLDAVRAEMEGIVNRAQSDTRDLTEDESARFEALDAEAKEFERKLDAEQAERMKIEAEAKAREDRVAALKSRMVTPSVQVTRDEPVYTPERASFFADIYRAKNGDYEAADRIRRNNAQRLGTRAINTTFGTGGEFVPPLWMEQEFIKLARPGRPFANVVHRETLPAGTDSINIPKVSTGTAVAIQGTQNAAVQQTDLTSTSISASVKTLAGGQTVSMQLVEQSPLSVDRIVLGDLSAAYGVGVDNYVLNDSAEGVIAAGTQVALTGTATGATAAAAIYSSVANTIGTFNTTRYLPPTHIVMHPRRWYWLVGLVDTNNRPFVVPNQMAYNPLASSAVVENEGIVGTMLGLPVMIDATIPTNLGTGTNQDAILIVRASDLWLFEGAVKAEAFPQTYANQLSLFVRLYNYLAFTAKRYAASAQVITGTQLNVLT